MTPQIFAGLFIELRLWVTDYQAGLPGRALEDHIDAEGPGLFGARSAIYGQIAVESCLLRDADHLPIQFPQNRSVVLSDIRDKIQNTFQLPLAHKSGGSIGSFVGIGQVTLAVIYSRVAVPHPHDHQNQQGKKPHADAKTIKTVRKVKGCCKAQEEVGIWKIRGSPVDSPCCLPPLIVVEQLGQVSTSIQKGQYGDWHRNQAFNQFLPGYGAHSFHTVQSRCSEM